MTTKIKLVQLAVILASVFALATAGNAKIQYFEDFEGFKKGHDITQEPGWEHYGPGKGLVDSDASTWIEGNCKKLGDKSIFAAEGLLPDFGLRFLYPTLGFTLQETSVIGCWVMQGPGPTNRFNVMIQDAAGNQYTLSKSENGAFFQYLSELDGTGWVETKIPFQSDQWYQVMWAGTGITLNLYVMDSSGNETLIYKSKASGVISTPYVRLLIRWDTRADNVFVADSKEDIDEMCNFAVKSTGKLATTWASIRVKQLKIEE